MNQDVGDDHFVVQLGMFAFVAWILICTDVVPGTAVEPSLLHLGDVVRGKVVTQSVSCVHGRPERAALRMNSNAHRIANTPGKYPQRRAVGVRFENVGSVKLGWIVIGVVVV